MINKTEHIPVLLEETLKALSIKNEEFYIDATFGLGGYTKAILKEKKCTVLGVDRDPEALPIAKSIKLEFDNRFYFKNAKFSQIEQFLEPFNIKKVAGVVFDLGVSSPQLDQKHRGFSFKLNGPLDMRMSKEGPTAEEFINKVEENTLASILFELGDEVFSRRIARNIILERRINSITKTGQLASIIRKAIPTSKHKIDPATKTFQAIRIYLNDEVSELEKGLIAAEKILQPNGILAVVSFHSIEDRIIKKFFLKCSQHKNLSRHLPDIPLKQNSLNILTKKPILPSASEIKYNKRSRSAKLRVAERTIFPSQYRGVA
ncbi:16S rRNA (cytosine(1402)-N(4))-methyltransferase RsmH [Alphaproteobacteria bacterium]|nr:16S rRNA (cytosine(1402)-N(4))-methyltransferase RsmH [Alphaproteobacteria bacterium]